MTAAEYAKDKVASYTRLSNRYKDIARCASDREARADAAARANVFEMAAEEFGNVLELLEDERRTPLLARSAGSAVKCRGCGKMMRNVSPNKQYCPDCIRKRTREQAKRYYHESHEVRKRLSEKKAAEERDAAFVAENQRLEALGGSYGKGRLKEYLATQNKKPSGVTSTGEPAKG